MDSKKKRNKVSANFENKINAEKKRNKVNSCLRPSLTLILTISLKTGSTSSLTPRSLPSSIESLFPSSTSILTSRLTLSLMPRSTSSPTWSSISSLTPRQSSLLGSSSGPASRRHVQYQVGLLAPRKSSTPRRLSMPRRSSGKTRGTKKEE